MSLHCPPQVSSVTHLAGEDEVNGRIEVEDERPRHSIGLCAICNCMLLAETLQILTKYQILVLMIDTPGDSKIERRGRFAGTDGWRAVGREAVAYPSGRYHHLAW